MKTCTKCGGEREQIGKRKHMICRQCQNRRAREWCRKNRELVNEKQRARDAANPERRKEQRLASRMKYRERYNEKQRATRAKDPEHAREVYRAWYAKNAEHLKAKSQAWRVTNKELLRRLQRVAQWRRGGIVLTWDEYQRMQVDQDFRCANAGCRAKPDKNKLVPDHDHSFGDAVFGNVRALICDMCNKVIGLLGDSPVRLRGLASYLEKHPPRLKMVQSEGPPVAEPSQRNGA